jgi:glucan endo-1,3-beta-D-glucosidase
MFTHFPLRHFRNSLFTMFIFSLLFLLTLWLEPATAVHTGFCYGNRWDDHTPKTYADFQRAFTDAQNLPGIPYRTFNSARLFTCIQQGTENEPIAAFEAAIDTRTTLLLGIWIPGTDRTTGISPSIDNELAALDTALSLFGQPFADLVVGVSVGSEDIFRYSDECDPTTTDCHGSPVNQVEAKISEVRSKLEGTLLEGKPIGHVDITQFASQPKDMNFTGMTVYPYWAKSQIADAYASFSESFNFIHQSNSTPIWIAETGWPILGPMQETAAASRDNMQNYWTQVGCKLFGKYDLWWFELEDDSNEPGIEFDWAILDSETRQPRIDLRCPEFESSGQNNSTIVSLPSLAVSHNLSMPMTFLTPATSVTPLSALATTVTPSINLPPSSDQQSAISRTNSNSTVIITVKECVTVFDVGGTIMTLTINTYTNDDCPTPSAIILEEYSTSIDQTDTLSSLTDSCPTSVLPSGLQAPSETLSNPMALQSASFESPIQTTSASSFVSFDPPVEATSIDSLVPFETPVLATLGRRAIFNHARVWYVDL